MATQEPTLNDYDEIVNKIQYDEEKTTYPSVHGDIVLPTSYAELDISDYVQIIHDVEGVLNAITELFGSGANAAFMEVVDNAGIGLAAVNYFQEGYNRLSTEVNFSGNYSEKKKDKSEKFDVYGVQHIFFINYTKEGKVVVTNMSYVLQNILFGIVRFANKDAINADVFIKHVNDLKNKTNTTFNDADVEITLQNYVNFYSLLFGFKAFLYVTDEDIRNVSLYGYDTSNKKLALLASKGYNIDMLYLFYLNDYYPTDEELDELNKMPYNWRVAAINSR